MRDITLLGFTLPAIRDLGEDRVRLVHNDQHQPWLACGSAAAEHPSGPGPIADGWPGREAGDNDVRIDVWPSFATTAEEGTCG